MLYKVKQKEVIKLFNPYHDSLGRFASKAGNIKAKVKEHIRNNKGKYTVGGTLAAAAIGTYLTHEAGKNYRENLRVSHDTIDNIPVMIVGKPKITKDLMDKIHRGKSLVEKNIGETHSTELVITDNYMDALMEYYGKPFVSKANRFFESNLRAHALGNNTFVNNIKLGATHILENKLNINKAWAFNLLGTGSIFIKDNSTLGTITHELTHTVKKQTPRNLIDRESLLKYEGIVDAISEHLTGEKGFLAYSKYREKYLDRYKNRSFEERSRIFKDILEKANDSLYEIPTEYDFKLEENVEDIFTLIAVIEGYYDLVKDEFEKIVNEYIQETIELEEIQLFNPYHDSLGRFTTGPSASSALFGIGGSSVGISGKGVLKDAAKILDAVDSTLYGGTTDPKITTSMNWSEVKSKTGINSNQFLGAYVSGLNEIVISPAGLSAIRTNPRLLNRIMTHESVHSRRRSTNRPLTFINSKHAMFEEGLTDLISLAPVNNKINYNYSASPYYKQMQAVARAARQSSNGDISKAWQWITQSHYYNDDFLAINGRMNGLGDSIFRGTGTSSDIDWLFRDVPTRLEITDEEFTNMMKDSEIAKYEALGIKLEL